ncbi:MAG TPA: LptF/LptG family permease, partial [Gemmatimonadaceae bacterium]|nr:LptF/LptG family permease [Gemmatimonadaceae bacterium]
GLSEVVPVTNQRRSELLREDKAQVGTSRYNFAYGGEYGRVYKAFELRTDSGRIRSLQIERKGSGPAYPTYLLTAETAKYAGPRKAGDLSVTPAPSTAVATKTPGAATVTSAPIAASIPDAPANARTPWTLSKGQLNVISDTGPAFTISFETAQDFHFTERPAEMMSKAPDPHNMRYRDITRFINAIERSGGDAKVSRVERALKIAVPVTCVIIALFGAPLATSTQRGGSAYGIAVSLATTMIFLLMIQLTKAIGGKGVIPADYAAWIPGAIFGLIGLVLLARVRT